MINTDEQICGPFKAEPKDPLTECLNLIKERDNHLEQKRHHEIEARRSETDLSDKLTKYIIAEKPLRTLEWVYEIHRGDSPKEYSTITLESNSSEGINRSILGELYHSNGDYPIYIYPNNETRVRITSYLISIYITPKEPITEKTFRWLKDAGIFDATKETNTNLIENKKLLKEIKERITEEKKIESILNNLPKPTE